MSKLFNFLSNKAHFKRKKLHGSFKWTPCGSGKKYKQCYVIIYIGVGMMSREEIKNYIRNKKNTMNDITLDYFANYFCVLLNNPQILGNISVEKLIDNALLYASKIEFYDESSEIYNELGPDCKGLREPQSKIIYVRNDLGEPLREMIVYHELHHAVQTNPLNDEVGINQESNIGRMIMEAQTQYFAEKVYQEIHNVTFEEKDIPSEELRMMNGGIITSALHNYEMYDSILSKLSIMLNVSKDFFVGINYLYENNDSINKLKQVYEKAKKLYNFPYEFEDFMFRLDYAYCVDLIAYKENPDKKVVLGGNETKNKYEIYPGKSAKLSLKMQFDVLDDIDRKYFLCLLEANANYRDFSKYLLKNETRSLVSQFVEDEMEVSKAK